MPVDDTLQPAAEMAVHQPANPVSDTFPARRGFSGRRDALILRLCRTWLADAAHGRLHLVLPSGLSARIGNGGAGPEASLSLANFRPVWNIWRRGALGFAESYMTGDVGTADLKALLQYFVANETALTAAGRDIYRTRLHDRLYHRLRANTPRGSRRNIAHHYDLGNRFYELWLDTGMTYSSGLFTRPAMTLADAQAAKIARIIDALDLSPGQSLLEIGCGWGGFAEAATRAGARVTGITLSAEQLAYARARPGQTAELRFEDYRATSGAFDRLVSIEMIEAVGEAHWPAYFRMLSDRLAAGGVAVLQAITIAPQHFPAYRRKADFIQRYIFPGGMLPTTAIMAEQAHAHGLGFETVETFADSYVRTLVEWRRQFRDAWPAIRELGFDDRFRRMWEYYLTYCEVGFEDRSIDVGIYRLVKC